MEPKIKRRIAIGAAGLAVVAGGGGAYAASQSGDDEGKEYLEDAAKRLNVSPDRLEDALQGAFADRLDDAVKEGRLTKEQADRIKERVRERGGVPPFPGGPGGFGGPGRAFHHHGGGPIKAGFDAAAKYLGLSKAQLREQLSEGKSLAQVAKARNKAVDGLKDAIKDAAKKELDKAVSDKRLTDAQRDRILSHLDEMVDRVVDRSPHRMRFRGPHGPDFRGGPDGPDGPPGFGGPPPPP
jgi:hypothetical protein